MEFKVVQKELELQSRGWIPTFHDVTTEVNAIVEASGVKNGTVCVASHHTTCSVMIQECSHDIDSFDLEYLQHDLLDIMRKMIPDFAEEHQYRHPGPIHAQYGRYRGRARRFHQHEYRRPPAQRVLRPQRMPSPLRTASSIPANSRTSTSSTGIMSARAAAS